jgi:glycosyltransferase involved in cell wall biosynthesis
MTENKILIVTYYWPPSGGAAVQRWLSFANKLAERSWEVHLLTVDERYATYQLYDNSLKGQVDARITVHTTKTFEPFGLYKSLFGKESIPKPAFSNEGSPSFAKKTARFIRGNLFIPDPRKGWKRFAVPKAKEILASRGIRSVITAGPPHSTHAIGAELQRAAGVKWIADFHDLWTDVIYYDMLYHLPFVKKRDLQLERQVLETADVVLTVGDQYKDKLLSKSAAIEADKIKVVRIGYDEKVVAAAVSSPVTNAFVITYTGSIADFYEPGVFIEALKSTVHRFPKTKFVLRFVGVLSGGIREHIVAAGLGGILEETGYVSHAVSVGYLKAASVLLLVNPRTKDEAMVIPGKLYEYLAVQKPIINITIAGAETARIIEECERGETFDRHETVRLEAYLLNLVNKRTATGGASTARHDATVAQYARGEITRLLEQAIT